MILDRGAIAHSSPNTTNTSATITRTFPGAKEFMVSHGVEVIDLNLDDCEQMMSEFIETNPQLWNEDIGN